MVGEVVELMVRHSPGDEMRAYERLLGDAIEGDRHALRAGGRSAGGLGHRRARAARARPGSRVRAWIVGAAPKPTPSSNAMAGGTTRRSARHCPRHRHLCSADLQVRPFTAGLKACTTTGFAGVAEGVKRVRAGLFSRINYPLPPLRIGSCASCGVVRFRSTFWVCAGPSSRFVSPRFATFVSCLLAMQQRPECRRRIGPHRGQRMPVHIERHRHFRVAESCTDHLNRHARL